MRYKDYYCVFDTSKKFNKWVIYKDNPIAIERPFAVFDHRHDALLYFLSLRLQCRLFFSDEKGFLEGTIIYSTDTFKHDLKLLKTNPTKELKLKRALFILPDGRLDDSMIRTYFETNQVMFDSMDKISIYDAKIPDKDFDDSSVLRTDVIKHTANGSVYTHPHIPKPKPKPLVNEIDSFKSELADNSGEVKSKYISNDVLYNTNPTKDEVENQTTGLVDLSQEIARNQADSEIAKKSRAYRIFLIIFLIILVIAAIYGISYVIVAKYWPNLNWPIFNFK